MKIHPVCHARGNVAYALICSFSQLCLIAAHMVRNDKQGKRKNKKRETYLVVVMQIATAVKDKAAIQVSSTGRLDKL